MCDGVHRLRLLNGTTIVSFADDIAIISVAKTVREIEEKTSTTIRNVGAWLDEAGLTLAAHKTKAVLISGRKIVVKMEVTVGASTIESNRAIKYLGVIIDDGICNTACTGEDNAEYWRTRSFQKKDNCGGSNIDNAVCLPNMVGGGYCPRCIV